METTIAAIEAVIENSGCMAVAQLAAAKIPDPTI
jgi:hypothetical protein